ncbi:DNA circularization protein [Pseudomonas guariconensis]|uniref:DNA circularization protein n=1 Tax=Pseudomonas guariconensis TaxID=1288410 RepID=UPI002B056D41|nr:DNA circularization N-terminal domain-containing protein [Pseudomonas guariconensis]
MSWSETLLDASFRGQSIQVVEESLQCQYAIAQHGTPYRNGDSSEGLGRGARVFSMRLVLFGENYELELQALLKALDVIEPGELIHPIYGAVSVLTGSNWVSHSADRPDYCDVQVQFIEQLPDAPFFERQIEYVDVGVLGPDDEYTWQDGVFDFFGKLDSLISEVQGWIGGGWMGVLERALGLPGIGLRLQQLRSQIAGVVANLVGLAGGGSSGSGGSSAYDPLVVVARTPTEIRAAIRSITPATSRDLQSRSAIPSVMPGGSWLMPEAAHAADNLLAAARQGSEPDPDWLPLGMPLDPAESVSWQLVILVVTELACANAESVAVVLDNEAAEPVLSPDDLESLVNLIRSLIQASILLQRRLYGVETARPVIEGLRDLAAMIQAKARRIILSRPPLIIRTVESPASLRLLAFRWYGDHSRANELLRLNPGLRNPHNIQRGEALRSYAT